jgi:hypothetical protein
VSEPTCALWYWSHGAVSYELYDDETAAVRAAIYMADDGDYGFPAGVQKADGSYTPLEDWAAYTAEQLRLTRAVSSAVDARASRPRPATREVQPPFETRHDQTLAVPADAPSWLGRQAESPRPQGDE